MTAQLRDSVLYQGRGFALLKSHGSGLFEPTAHGLSPRAFSTACHRGWFCTYALVEQSLRLCELHIGLEAPLPLAAKYGKGPRLFGRAPAFSERFHCVVFQELDELVRFSGTWVLGREAVRVEPQADPLFPEWRFREVLQLVFDEGRLVETSEDTEDTERFRVT